MKKALFKSREMLYNHREVIDLPSTYAHYRFGALAVPALPEEIRRSVQRFRQLYDVGLHGPDLFFFYQPLFQTKMGALGSRYHAMTGTEFFEKAVQQLHQAPSEGAQVYLYGVLGHYALDSVCHPLILETAAEGKLGHVEIETEFDRYLLARDGKEPPHLQRLARHARLTWGECVTVSHFYPPASAYTIRHSVRHMYLADWLLSAKNREALTRLLRLGGPDVAQMVMYTRPNHSCATMNEPLETLFGEALERYPRMVEQLQSHFFTGVAFGPEFEAAFG